MAAGVLVAVADHRGQRGRFAGTGRTDEQHQAALGHRQLFQHFGKFQVFQRWNVGLDSAQHHAGKVALIEGADPKTADAARTDGEVAFMVFGELATLLLVHHRMDRLAGHLRRHRRFVHRKDLAVDLH